MPENQNQEKLPQRLSDRWRQGLTATLMATSLTGFVYWILDDSELRQTSALFIGLPLLLGLSVIHLTRTRSRYGTTVQANLIFLCIVAPLLGEGSICLIMAAPLFFVVSLLGVFLFSSFRSGKLMSWAVVPLIMILSMFEANHRTIPLESVTTAYPVHGTLEDWRQRVRHPANTLGAPSFFLSLGFPLPQTYSGDPHHLQARDSDYLQTRDLHHLKIEFQQGKTPVGRWEISVEERADGVAFHVQKDSTPIANWIRVVDSTVQLKAADHDQILLIQTTRFEPLLSPFWYFVPLERYAIEQTHELALNTWKASDPAILRK